MSELENLSNDELRIELLKYGFANMPVTSTTRKILLKKLKNAKETQKSKNRRETVAVMKASDDEDPEELGRGKKERTPNRRATVAVLEKTKKVPATTTTQNGSDTPPKKDKSRRSSRTPAKDNSKPVVSSTAASLLEQSDDDVIEIIEPILTRRSKSKTPTLAKSETVRTSVSSYTRTVPIVREEDVSTEEEDRSYEIEFQEPPPPVTRRTTTLSYSNKPTATKSSGKTLSTSFNPTISYKKLESDENDDDEDGIEAPYLSSFAQRLSTLRAEPLGESLKKYQKESTYSQQPTTSFSSNYRYSSSSSQYGTQPQNRASVGDALAKEYKKLDRKYNINKYVVICMIIMAIVAVYVIFFT